MTALPPAVETDLREENARLRGELRAARDRQAAGAEILRAIASGPIDAERALQRIAEITERLFGASSVSLLIADGERWGRTIRVGAGSERIATAIPLAHVAITPKFMPGEVYLENRQVHVSDIDDPAAMARWPGLAPARAAGTRTMSGTPLRREGRAIGALIVHRDRPVPFTEDELALLQSFADQAAIATENARLFNETKEALERQTATSDILRVISQSPTDVRPVFDAIVLTATRLLRCDMAFFLRCHGATFSQAALVGSEGSRPALDLTPVPIDPDANFPSRAIVSKKNLHLPDWSTIDLPEHERHIRETYGINSSLFLPLLRAGECVGLLALAGKRPDMFGESEIALAESFRDQALIAIENTRLFNETKEALERQTATADILKVIASSPSDVQPVFEAIAERSKRLVDALSTTVFRLVDGMMHLKAFTPTNPEADATLKALFPVPLSNFSWGGAIGKGEIFRVIDTEREIAAIRDLARLRGFRSMLFVPLLRGRTPIGVIAVTRVEPGPFVEHHVQLLQTFADQAVIAIENVRLFDEVQAKTSDLTEALQQQTATAEVLKVISRSAFDLDIVLNSLTKSAVELCNSTYGAISLYRDGVLVFMAQTGCTPEFAELLWSHPAQLDRKSVTGRAGLLRTIVQVPDVMQDEDYDYHGGESIGNYRSCTGVPLLRNGELEGVFTLMRREPGNFTPRQVELVQTFADQAVIAIENVRLFDEVQARTEDLRESLEFQTASSDVLKVISSSPDSLQPVLDVIVETSRQLCGTETSTIFLLHDNKFHIAAAAGAMPEYLEFLRENPIAPDQRGSSTSRAAREKRTVHIPDIGADPEFGQGPMAVGQRRALLSVPLMREGMAIGVITMRQSHLTPFTDRQIEVVQTFADQAVIAISNVRLFEQVQARTRELSQSLDELRTAQDRLVQTEKLASLGQLTAGIAHEIKNPLNFVNNFSALSAELTDELNDVLKSATLAGNIREEVDELTGLLKDNLQKVVQHGKRADSIVKNMLLHSREGSGEHRPADINALLDESLNLAYHGARAEKPQFNVTLQRDFDEAAGTIEVFPQEITRVFLNLISNGFYAVTKRKMEIDHSDFDPIISATTRNLGQAVEIRIRDNGTGIPAEVKEKMFNPFFTTKPAGEGTGLGLSMSHDIIVKQHGGAIDVDTEPGQFTEFRIVLPRTSNLSKKTRG